MFIARTPMTGNSRSDVEPAITSNGGFDHAEETHLSRRHIVGADDVTSRIRSEQNFRWRGRLPAAKDNDRRRVRCDRRQVLGKVRRDVSGRDWASEWDQTGIQHYEVLWPDPA